MTPPPLHNHLLICLLSEIVKFLIKLQLYTKNSKD